MLGRPTNAGLPHSHPDYSFQAFHRSSLRWPSLRCAHADLYQIFRAQFPEQEGQSKAWLAMNSKDLVGETLHKPTRVSTRTHTSNVDSILRQGSTTPPDSSEPLFGRSSERQNNPCLLGRSTTQARVKLHMVVRIRQPLTRQKDGHQLDATAAVSFRTGRGGPRGSTGVFRLALRATWWTALSTSSVIIRTCRLLGKSTGQRHGTSERRAKQIKM